MKSLINNIKYAINTHGEYIYIGTRCSGIYGKFTVLNINMLEGQTELIYVYDHGPKSSSVEYWQGCRVIK